MFSLAVLECHLGSLWICRCLETLVLLDLMRLEKCLVVSTGSEWAWCLQLNSLGSVTWNSWGRKQQPLKPCWRNHTLLFPPAVVRSPSSSKEWVSKQEWGLLWRQKCQATWPLPVCTSFRKSDFTQPFALMHSMCTISSCSLAVIQHPTVCTHHHQGLLGCSRWVALNKTAR